VTLDSVEPPEEVTAGSFAPNAREGFDRLFRTCAEQPQCWPRRPGIERTFTMLVRRLEARPVATRVESPTGGPQVRVVLDGGALVNWLIDVGFNTSWARIAAGTLSNSTAADLAGIGHAVTLASPCAQEVFASFLATPSAPDTGCVAAVRPPTFAPAPPTPPRGPGRG
jgi:hypothetical protein